MTLIFLPYYLLAIAFLFAVVKHYIYKDVSYWEYLNLEKVFGHKLFLPVVVADLALVIIGLVFPPVVILRFVTWIALIGFGTYWLVDSWQHGHIKTWYNDIKKYFSE